MVGSPKCSTCWSTGSGRRLANTSPASSSTGKRLAWARPAAVTMLVGAGPDRGGRHHQLAPLLGLGERDGGERHGLLVLAAPGRQHVLHGFERFGQAGDIAVAEDAEHAGEQRHPGAFEFGELVAKVAHDGLRHGQADGLHAGSSRGRSSPTSPQKAYCRNRTLCNDKGRKTAGRNAWSRMASGGCGPTTSR